MVSIKELRKKVEDFEGKFELSRLETKKKLADIELRLAQIDQKFKEVWTSFPQIKTRSEETQDLINIINLGLIEFKRKFEETDKRLLNLEKIPSDVKRTVEGLEEKLKSLEENINKVSESVNSLSSLKEEVNKSVQEALAKFDALREDYERYKSEVLSMKNQLDAFSSSIKSFERTFQLSKTDEVFKRFDVMEGKIAGMEAEVKKILDSMKNTSILESDVEVLKRNMKEMRSSMMDALNKIDEIEMSFNKKFASLENLEMKAEHLQYIEDTYRRMKEEAERIEKLKSEMEETFRKMKSIEESVLKSSSEIENLRVNLTQTREMSERNRIKLEEMKRLGLDERVKDLSMRLRKLEESLAGTKTEELKSEMQRMKESLSNMSKFFEETSKKTVELESKIINLSQAVNESKLQVETLKKEEVFKLLMDNERIKKILKQLSERVDLLKSEKAVSMIPRGKLLEEIESLKKVVQNLSEEKEKMKKAMEEKPEIEKRIENLEKKLKEIEKELASLGYKPVIIE